MVQEQPPEEPANPLMRKKKTPEELAREAEAEDEDEFTSKLIIFFIPLEIIDECKKSIFCG